MKSEIIINVQNRETRAAVAEDGRLAEVYVERSGQVVGSIYKCRVKNVLGGMDAAFVDIGMKKNAFLYSGDILPYTLNTDMKNIRGRKSAHAITGMIREGQEFLVQVVKAPRAAKGARVSTRITLPGRYIVLLPECDNIGISKRIDAEEHIRLKDILTSVRPEGFGIIARTEAEGRTAEEISHDIDMMKKVWNGICESAAETAAPAMIYQELSIIYKIIRDNFTDSINCMYIDDEGKFKKAKELAKALAPHLANRIKLYTGNLPIFEHFGLERDYNQMFKRKIWLQSGGYICIDIAEAMTVIDVNTGKYIGSKSLKETILTTNLQAAEEIARQIRLRDLGGIITVDFIDMTNPADQGKLIKHFKTALSKERAKTAVSQISELGLIELNRKRVSETVGEAMTEVCPYCSGRGRVESSETVSLRIERDLRGFLHKTKHDYAVSITANPETAQYLIGDGGSNVKELEELHNIPIFIRANNLTHIEDYKLEYLSKEQADILSAEFSVGQTLTAKIERGISEDEEKAIAWAEGCLIEIPHGSKYIGKTVTLKITEIHNSRTEARIKTGKNPQK